MRAGLRWPQRLLRRRVEHFTGVPEQGQFVAGKIGKGVEVFHAHVQPIDDVEMCLREELAHRLAFERFGHFGVQKDTEVVGQ